jgi:hypothetical protein
MASKARNAHLRRHIAYEAARLMAEQGIADHQRALQKAAARAGMKDRRNWPEAAEIHAALMEQQRLFRPRQPEHLRQLRETALAAMRAFSAFHPRLVGPVLDGSADESSRVQLQLFAETPEEVVHALLDQGIPWQEHQRKLRHADGATRVCPALRFMAGGVPMELLVLSARERSNPPLNPLTERPERGAGEHQLQQLLESDDLL